MSSSQLDLIQCWLPFKRIKIKLNFIQNMLQFARVSVALMSRTFHKYRVEIKVIFYLCESYFSCFWLFTAEKQIWSRSYTTVKKNFMTYLKIPWIIFWVEMLCHNSQRSPRFLQIQLVNVCIETHYFLWNFFIVSLKFVVS